MKIEKQCSECGNPTTFNFSDKIIDNQLRWSASEWCTTCDYGLEIDDSGRLPDSLRQLMLQNIGVWHLILPQDISVNLLKTIREIFDVSPLEAKQLANSSDDERWYGTQTEMRYLMMRLSVGTEESLLNIQKKSVP